MKVNKINSLSIITKRNPGFTFLEVLVSFSILAVLLTVIIQTQGETIRFLDKTNKLSLVQKTVINELLTIERNYLSKPLNNAEGTYPEGHLLAGDKWKRITTKENFLDIVQINKITFRVTWIDSGQEHSFESSVWGEVR